MNYYNEIDPQAAQWLRNLISAGHIPPGDVDERSIEDVKPNELRGYTQHHFFAGIGGWSLALDLAGWPRDRPVWTGSCPCQPFSSAGKGDGFADKRHLWPAFQHLIAQCRPAVVFGEQVASKATDAWVDLVHADLENMDYAFGCIPFSAASIGAPHIRDRNYWVADAELHGRDARALGRGFGEGKEDRRMQQSEGRCSVIGLADTDGAGSFARSRGAEAARHGNSTIADGRPVGMADAMRDGAGNGPGQGVGSEAAIDRGHGSLSGQRLRARVQGSSSDARSPGPLHGFWRDADWLKCRDGKWRPVEPGTFPLAHGIPARVVRLRAYGNAIVPQVAAEFIRAYTQAQSEGVRVAA